MNTITHYPLNIGDSISWLSKAEYLKQRLDQLVDSHNLTISTNRFKDVLEAIENGMMNPADMEEWMDLVADDVTMAMEPKAESQPAVLDNEKIELGDDSSVGPVVSVGELAVIEAGKVDNVGAALGLVLRQFDPGANLNQLVCTEDTKDTDLGMALATLLGVRDWTEWGIGDAINELKKRGYEHAEAQIASHLNRESDYQTLHGYAKTASVFTPGSRDFKGLSYSHYSEAGRAKYDSDPEKNREKALEVVRKASESGMNVAQTRALVKETQNKPEKPTPPPERVLPRYIIHVANCTGAICTFYSEAEPHTELGTIVIDTKEGMVSRVETKGGFHAWEPISPAPFAQFLPKLEPEVVEF